MTQPLTFDDAFVRELPGDLGPARSPRTVLGAAWSAAEPTPVVAPRLLAWVPEVADLLGLEGGPSPELVAALAGNAILPGMRPYAACYGGHQFGHWAGQLGDGRAVTLGEVLGPAAPSGQRPRWEVQLKGAGPTPYSRRADGRAVLRSSIRELVCSEAMHHLGVPTTRALALIGSGEPVLRDMFYDGHPRAEPGAIVTRVAPSFLRFGSFELPASRGDLALLTRLVDWTLVHHLAELGPPGPEARGRLYDEVCRRTGLMLAHWMTHGFVHGVMNTDNFSILGLTIDYGPYGWLDAYDPGFTPNTTDLPGRRYAYGRQPGIAMWNLARLGEALFALLGEDGVERGLEIYRGTVQSSYARMMSAKLGLDPRHEPAERDALLGDLFALMSTLETDWTIFFRALASVEVGAALAEPEAALTPLKGAFYLPEGTPLPADLQALTSAWVARWARSADPDASSRRVTMDAANPWFIPRNYLVQGAIDRAEAGDLSELERLMAVAREPYRDHPEHPDLHRRRPEWARHRAGCSALSCSS